MNRKHFILFVLILLASTVKVDAQVDSLKSRLLKIADKKFLITPGVSYSPETDFLFGIASIYKLTPKWKDSADRESYLRFASSYSLKKQFSVDLGYRIASNKERFVSFGEIGYSKFPNTYFGHGNGIDYDSSEKYTPTSIRLRLNGLIKISPWLSIGPRFQFDNYRKVEYLDSGILFHDAVQGKHGGMAAGLGYIVNSDKRNSIFIPSEGYYAIFRHVFFRDWVGSDFDFNLYQYDLRKYIKLNKKHVLAIQHYGHYTSGDVPFYQLATFGGSYRMRGHFSGAYRDKNASLFQMDFRYKLSKYFVWSVFSGIGWIEEDISKIKWSDNRISLGSGLRLYAPSSGLAFRLDFAFARENSGIYFGIGEAF